MTIKTGALSAADLMAVWAGSVDSTYSEPLLRAGDGGGLEVYSQAAEVFARVSRAVDATTQSMYILPWSGQTAPPASGEARASVMISVARAGMAHQPLVLARGTFWLDEVATDHGPTGPVQVTTGRRYVLAEDFVLAPGDCGPAAVPFVAERPGMGYNNPLPGTISGIEQVGGDFEHDRATVTLVGPFAASLAAIPASARIASVNEADTFLPDHVGQWLLFTAGANAGVVARITAFLAQPDPVANVGSVVEVELTHAMRCSVFAGTFQPGELLRFATPDGFGLLEGASVAAGKLALVYRFLSGAPAVIGATIVGVTSGATATVDMVLADQLFVAEAPAGGVGGASWRILSWAGVDFQLTASNPESPTGGLAGMLDELGREREVDRASGEPDDVYRLRVAQPADVVTPNAIRRALARALGSVAWTFREVGSALLPGVFYDGDLSPASATPHGARNDAYDYGTWEINGTFDAGPFFFNERVVLEHPDGTFMAAGFYGGDRPAGGGQRTFLFIPKNGRPAAGATWRIRGLSSGQTFSTAAFQRYVDPPADPNLYRRVFDYTQFRAFFLVTVQRLGMGEFGVAYDVGAHNAFDVLPPYVCVFGGGPVANGPLLLGAAQGVDLAHAGGVSYDFEQVPVSAPVSP